MAKIKQHIDIEFIVNAIINGDTFREIAEELDVSLSTLHDFTAKSEHSARVRLALEISADSYSDKAEQVLQEAEGTQVEIQRARELAQHYRWKAAKRAPRKYGDKLDITTAGEAITTKAITIEPVSKD